MNHEPLIDLDTVARAMTEAELSADFRARVLARLDTPAPARGWLPVIATVATVAAGVVALVTSGRPGNSDAITEPAATPTPVTVSVAKSEDANEPSRSASRARPAAMANPAADRQISADELAWHARALPPLPAMPDVVIEPIQPSALSIAPMVVTPLVTEPLTVPPIEVGGGGRSPVPQFPSSPVS